jgi:hypothetical protein
MTTARNLTINNKIVTNTKSVETLICVLIKNFRLAINFKVEWI